MDQDPFARWPELDRWFAEALECAPGERGAYLDEVCGTDAALRAELERLLAAHGAEDAFLEEPAAWPGDAAAGDLTATADAAAWVGRTVSHYEIEGLLGSGGMGVVYQARDTKLDRPVTLKFLQPHLLTDATAKTRFIHEAQAASALDHAHICTIHEIGETADGQLFIAMAYYDGETLKERIARGPLPLEESVRIAAQIADALGRAHEAGIVHRDLKPANVMLTARGEVKLLDFGIAKLEGGAELTETGVPLGTVAYMSPEQARGVGVDHRTDVWALGVVLYEMLTGVRPFGGEHPQVVLHSILTEEPAPLTTARPEVPGALAAVVERALAKDPAARYATMAEVRVALRALHRGSRRSFAALIGRGTVNRRRRLWLVAAVSAVAAASGAVGFAIWQTGQGRAAGDDPVLALPTGPSIAVIPFTNLSADSGDVFFSDGLSEDIVADLTRFSELFVLSLGSTIRYKGTPVDVQQVRDDLGVDYVLQGSVRRSPERIRVTVRLTDAADGGSLWNEQFDLDPTAADLFDMQDQITHQVVGAIGGSTGVISRARIGVVRERETDSFEAYECVLRAHEYIIDHGPPAHLLALDCLEEAVQIDPGYVEAWGWLSYIYAEVGRHSWNRRDYDPLERALATAQHAISLDPGNYLGYFGLAVTYFDMHDLEPFRVAAERALELNPNDANLLAIIGDYLSEASDFDRGLALLRKSMALNPNHPGWLYSGFFLDLYIRRQYEAALTEARRINMPNSYRAPFYEAAALGQLGRTAEAKVSLERLQALRPDLVSIEAVRDDLDGYNHPPDVAEHLLEGLRKAGLPDSLGAR